MQLEKHSWKRGYKLLEEPARCFPTPSSMSRNSTKHNDIYEVFWELSEGCKVSERGERSSRMAFELSTSILRTNRRRDDAMVLPGGEMVSRHCGVLFYVQFYLLTSGITLNDNPRTNVVAMSENERSCSPGWNYLLSRYEPSFRYHCDSVDALRRSANCRLDPRGNDAIVWDDERHCCPEIRVST